MSPNLSEAQLLSFLQCPRRFWLEQYHPELEGDVTAMNLTLDAEEAANAAAHQLIGDNAYSVSGRLGLRNAIEQTASLIEPGRILLDATFEHEGVSIRVDVLDWSNDARRAISVSAADETAAQHIEHCAIQAWAMRGLQLPEHEFFVGLSGREHAGDGLESRFDLVNVSERIGAAISDVGAVVNAAKALHAALEEPPAAPGAHCHKPGYPCPFLEHCEQG